MTGSAPAQGVPTAAVKVVGGSGGGGTKNVGIGCAVPRFFFFFKLFQMTGSASAQGVPTAAVKVVGGSGGGGTKKVGNRRRFGEFFLDFSNFLRFPKSPRRCRGASFFEKTRPSFWLFLALFLF